MQSKTSKVRIKRVNKKRMTDEEMRRLTAKNTKYTLLDHWFDDEPEEQAIAHHFNRRYP
jgi:hypothetical protein